MIKSKKGTVEFKGTPAEIYTDIVAILTGAKEIFPDELMDKALESSRKIANERANDIKED